MEEFIFQGYKHGACKSTAVKVTLFSVMQISAAC